MRFDYAPREYELLSEGLPIEHPEAPPELVHYDDPAMLVFTDFTQVRPLTVGRDVRIDEALQIMKYSGVRLLLVTGRDGTLAGLVTASQIMGDAPVRVAEVDRISRDSVTVGMIMTPASRARVLSMAHLRDARVGHIVATLHELEASHLLVVDGDVVRGLFSASQISRQLGREVMDPEAAARSLAEMVHGQRI